MSEWNAIGRILNVLVTQTHIEHTMDPGSMTTMPTDLAMDRATLTECEEIIKEIEKPDGELGTEDSHSDDGSLQDIYDKLEKLLLNKDKSLKYKIPENASDRLKYEMYTLMQSFEKGKKQPMPVEIQTTIESGIVYYTNLIGIGNVNTANNVKTRACREFLCFPNGSLQYILQQNASQILKQWYQEILRERENFWRKLRGEPEI